MISTGWFKFSRELFERAVWRQGTLEQNIILVNLMAMANFKRCEAIVDGKLCILHPGEFITSIKHIVEVCDKSTITVRKVRTALNKFQKLGIISIHPTSKFSKISFVDKMFLDCLDNDNEEYIFTNDDSKYNVSQGVDKELTNCEQIYSRESATDNNINNYNNINNINNYKLNNIKGDYTQPNNSINDYQPDSDFKRDFTQSNDIDDDIDVF